ncbi:MAG: hypothetical protein DI539_24580 [Flavobacterium psychrophilum]|nr:MAG: hypothetical protein DI539_24580 [Flavobacterium psychrophilum]
MGLFSFFNRKETHSNGSATNGASTAIALPEVPENVFIEKGKSQAATAEQQSSFYAGNGINLLFQFLEKDYEAKGYDDALMNPDTTHLEQNLNALKNDLERVVLRVKTFYEDFIREINYHITSRSRSGMVDTVEELSIKKETAEHHIKQVLEIEEQSKKNEGLGQGIIINYTKGFKNGLAAISHHNILKRNF